MKNKNQLSKILYKLLIELKITSGTVTQARDRLLELDEYSTRYDSQKLYKRLYQQLSRLKSYGLIKMSGKDDADIVSFQITPAFHPEDFVLGKITKNFPDVSRSANAAQKNVTTEVCFNGLLSKVIIERLQKIDDNISALILQKRRLELILRADNTYTRYANTFCDEAIDAVVNFLQQALDAQKP